MPSQKQIGTTKEDGKRIEPSLCAVSGRPCKGKPHVTHIGPDGQFVYVLAQYDHLWPKAAPAYGFPVEESAPASEDAAFVLPDIALDVAKVAAPSGDDKSAPGINGAFASLRPVIAATKITAPRETPKKDGE